MKLKVTLLISLMLLVSCFAFGQNLPRVLILTGNGNIPTQLENYPPWTHEFQNDKIIQILDGIAAVDTTTYLSELNDANLKKYDLVVSNSMFLEPNQQQLSALYRFVKNRKSYFTLHCGILSAMNWPQYQDFMGGHFIGGPSNDPNVFRVVTGSEEFWGFPLSFKKQVEHPIAKAVNDFDTQDELYYFQPSIKDIEVIARAENHPVMWWHKVGKGKVMSLTLGHDLHAKGNAGYQELLKNGVRWLTGAPLIYAEGDRTISDRFKLYPDFIDVANMSDIAAADIKSIMVDSDKPLFTINPNRSKKYDLHLTGKNGPGRYTLNVMNKAGKVTTRIFDVNIVADGLGNIAAYYGNKITATQPENTSTLFKAANLIDGDSLSRWSSIRCDEAFIILDMQKQYEISHIQVLWEASYAKKVEILASIDNSNWMSIYRNTNGKGGLEDVRVAATCRYLKFMLRDKPEGKRGFSIYEIRVN